MEGFDKDWYYVGTKHTVNYTNLNPGKYIFRVKGSNNDGVWNEKGVAFANTYHAIVLAYSMVQASISGSCSRNYFLGL